MPKEGKIKAILFDLDGTLVDSAPDLHTAANKLLGEENRREVSLEEITMMIGDGVPKLVERAFEATGDPIPDGDLNKLAARYLEFYEPHSADLTVPFPGGIECLAQLKRLGYALAVCTNKPYGATMEILGSLGLLDSLSVVIGGNTLPGIKKPDPRHLLAAVEKLGIKADEAIMVGDNANDVNAAKGASLPVIVCRFGYTKGPAEDLGGDRIIDHFDDLLATIGAMSRS
jgi:phosphoglycolate phosphatase